MRDRALEARIHQLAARAGIPDSRIYEVRKSDETRQVNAYVTGFGGTKRIVLWDTLVDRLEPDEVLFVMGHEMGHFVLRHTLTVILGATLLVTLSLYRGAPRGRLVDRPIPPALRIRPAGRRGVAAAAGAGGRRGHAGDDAGGAGALAVAGAGGRPLRPRDHPRQPGGRAGVRPAARREPRRAAHRAPVPAVARQPSGSGRPDRVRQPLPTLAARRAAPLRRPLPAAASLRSSIPEERRCRPTSSCRTAGCGTARAPDRRRAGSARRSPLPVLSARPLHLREGARCCWPRRSPRSCSASARRASSPCSWWTRWWPGSWRSRWSPRCSPTNGWLAARALGVSLAGAGLFWAARTVARAGHGPRLLAALAAAVVVGAVDRPDPGVRTGHDRPRQLDPGTGRHLRQPELHGPPGHDRAAGPDSGDGRGAAEAGLRAGRGGRGPRGRGPGALAVPSRVARRGGRAGSFSRWKDSGWDACGPTSGYGGG